MNDRILWDARVKRVNKMQKRGKYNEDISIEEEKVNEIYKI